MRTEGSLLKILRNGKETGRWYARLRYTDATGRYREKKRTCATYEKAKAKLQDLRSEIESELTPRRTYRELDEFYRKEYVHTARFVGGKKVSGFRQPLEIVEAYMDRALAFFGDADLGEITYSDLRRYKLDVQNTPAGVTASHPLGHHRSVSDTNHHLKRVRRLLKVAIEQGWLDIDPFTRGTPLIVESFEAERTRVLTAGEETRLLAECGPDSWRSHIVPIIVFAIETGCRRGEIQKLQWKDVDLAGRIIRIQASNTKTLKTRMVPITDRLRQTLAAIRGNMLRPYSPVFGDSNFHKAFRHACDAAGLEDVHFHDLRHTAITRMLEKGLPAPLVMKISGHTNSRTFMRYVNQTEQMIYDIAMQLDEAELRRWSKQA